MTAPRDPARSRGITPGTPEWTDAVRAAVAGAPPVDDATRVRLRGLLSAPVSSEPARTDRAGVAA